MISQTAIQTQPLSKYSLVWTRLSEICQPKIVGLAGPARCGKDTVASLLHRVFNTGSVAFADPIRDSLKAMLGLEWEHFHGKLKEVEIDWLGKSPRQLMQTLGTEWGRDRVNPDIWLLIAGRKMDKILEDRGVVVTDVRFENEAEYIRSKGGEVWHISRPGIQAVNAHASEAGVKFVPGVDKKIINDGTLDDLLTKVFDLY